jgi:hypothetical protein
MMRAMAFASMVLAAGCAPQLTEIIVVVDSDYTVPSELDAVEITVVPPTGEHEPVRSMRPALPISLGLVHRGGPLGPLEVEVRGMRGGVLVVSRSAVVSFVPGEVRELRMDLLRVCEGVSCSELSTCVAGVCAGRELPPSALPPWTGEHPLDGSVRDGGDAGLEDAGPLDAGPSDGGARDGGTSDGGARDGGTLDGGTRDAGCTCTLDHATSRCTPGGCLIESCETGWSDCDGMAVTGCERSIRTNDDCSACDRACSAPNAVTSCSDGVCRITRCSDVRRGDCNATVSDGCETHLDNDDDNCGTCEMMCTGSDRCRMSSCS